MKRFDIIAKLSNNLTDYWSKISITKYLKIHYILFCKFFTVPTFVLYGIIKIFEIKYAYMKKEFEH